MNRRNRPCPCGSGQKFKRCCLGAGRPAPWFQAAVHRPPPQGLDPVTTEAYLRAQEVLGASDVMKAMSDAMNLLRTMSREGGPLAGARWSWDELVPPVERHIFRVMEEVEDIEERHQLLFERCAPDLLSPGHLEKMERVWRQALMAPERTPEERRALGVAVMELMGASRGPPYTQQGLGIVSWLLTGQVDEWVARRKRIQTVVDRVLGQVPGSVRESVMSPEVMRRIAQEPDLLEVAIREAAKADPEMMLILSQYEIALLQGILEGRTPEVLHGEEWLWMTVVLRAPLRVVSEQAPDVSAEALLSRLDAEVQQAVLHRVEAASRDRSSSPEAEQWFTWAYKILVMRPLALFGAFAKTPGMPLRERFAGEAEWVVALRERESWRAEDLEPYRARLEAHGAHAAEQRVRRLQAYLRGETPLGVGSFRM